MQHTTVNTLGPVLLAALLFAAGCGGGGTTTTTTATKAATGGTTTGASGLSGLASSANCQQLKTVSSQFTQALTGSARAGDLKKMSQLLQEFAAKTPSDVRADFKVVADAYAKIFDAVGNVKPGATPDAAAIAKLQKLSTEIDEKRVARAWAHIGVWVKKNCRA